MSKPNAATPQPKRPKFSSPEKPSLAKSSPKKHLGPRKFSPKKLRKSPRKADPTPEGGEIPGGHSSGGSNPLEGSNNEAYYSANFKDVLGKCLLSSNPERHVICDEEVAVVEEFMRLDGK